MGASQPKAFLDLAGCPVVEHSLRVFQLHHEVDAIVLLVPPGYADRGRAMTARYPKVHAVEEGGRRRQDTVARGLARVTAMAGAGEGQFVIVHDAARPLVTPDLVTSVLEGARRTGAAVPGIGPADTVRELRGPAGEEPQMAGRTLDRERLVLVQTPQAFRLQTLVTAYAGDDGRDVTDDAALVQRMGLDVEVVPGSQSNFKITGPADLARAAFLLQSGG